MAKELTKKREVLPFIHSASIALANMSANAAKLEYHDNDSASRELKNDIVKFENEELKALKDMVKGIRGEINGKEKKTVKNRTINLGNLKQNQNKS